MLNVWVTEVIKDPTVLFAPTLKIFSVMGSENVAPGVVVQPPCQVPF
jgi:hypothetical protein